MSKLIKKLTVIFIIITFILIGLVCYSKYILLYSKITTQNKQVLINNGDTIYNTINRLTNNNQVKLIITKFYLKFSTNKYKIYPGIYELDANTSILDFLNKLNNNDSKQSKIALIPGLTWNKYKEILFNTPYLINDINNLTDKEIIEKFNLETVDGDNKKDSLEGYILADTYIYKLNLTKISDIIKISNNKLVSVLNKSWENRNEKSAVNNLYELLILASIIEKETGGLQIEYPIVSAVFNNRLSKGIKLQADPTVIYGMKDKYQGTIYQSFLKNNNPYNTYIIDRLPITPIANISKESINYAAKPANVNYLYFVAKGNNLKGHVFSETLSEHNKAVAEYRKSIKKDK